MTPAILDYFDGDWRLTMNVFGAFFLLLGVAWHLIGRERKDVPSLESEVGASSAGEFALVKKAVSFREVWIAGIGFTGAMMAFFPFNSFFPTMALDFYDVSLSGSGFVVAMYVLPGGVAGVIVAYYLKGVRGRAPILACAGAIIVTTYCCMTLTASYPLLGLPARRSLPRPALQRVYSCGFLENPLHLLLPTRWRFRVGP